MNMFSKMKPFEHAHNVNEKKNKSPKRYILHIANLLIKDSRFDLKKRSLSNAVTYFVNGKNCMNKRRK